MRRTVVTSVVAALLLAVVSGCGGGDTDLGVPSDASPDAGKAIAINPGDTLKKKTEGMENSKGKPATP
jgi:hypothetical protein